jgi:nardilysin
MQSSPPDDAGVVLLGPDLDATRSKSDKKLYRHITLGNGLKCVLICDTVAMRQRGKSLTVGDDRRRRRRRRDDDDDDDDDDESEDESEDDGSEEEDDDDDYGDEEEDDDDDDDEDDDEDPDGLRKAAAALLVNVGSYHDPPHLQGLSHFLEHMLFLGTEDYPEENAFDKFLSGRGGDDNAYTGGCPRSFVRSVIDDRRPPVIALIIIFAPQHTLRSCRRPPFFCPPLSPATRPR